MNKKFKLLLLPCLSALAILSAFVFTMPVHAQDELPPSDPVPVTDLALEIAPAGEPQVPEVALVTGTQEPIAVDSAEAAALPTAVDPWFKVGTTQYNFLYTGGSCGVLTNCTVTATPLQDAVDYIHAHGTIPSDGYIHVDAGTIPDQKVLVDGSVTYENNIKGIVGHVNLSTKSPDAILSSTDGVGGSWIVVDHKTNGFTLSGLSITGDSSYSSFFGGLVRMSVNTGSLLLQDLVVNNAYFDGNGITITGQNGLVTLKNVDSSGNASGGAYIDNTLGTTGVTITNSSFDDNQGDSSLYDAPGVTVFTKGAVSLLGVSASRNQGVAAASVWIDNTLGTAGVTINRGIFDKNYTTGLYVHTKGAITLTNIDASGNQNASTLAMGADLDSSIVATAVGVTITNSTFEDNWTTGLRIKTKGNVLLTNVASWDNDSTAGSYGVDIDNTYGTGNVTMTNQPSTDAAMLPGFNNNHDRGVNIHTNGLVILTNLNVLSNQEDGIRVWTELNKGVTLKNCRVDRNVWSFGEAGIVIYTVGPVVITDGHANNNVGFGVEVHNEIALNAAPKPVTISNFTAESNVGYGFYIRSKGAIKLTNVTADFTSGSPGNGIDLDNTSNISLTPPGITLLKVASYNNVHDGINFATNGTVSLTSITADWNARYGAYIVQNSVPPAYPTTTITTGSFSSNGSSGLTLYGRGAITLKDITADYNTAGNGARIHNIIGNVTLLASSAGGNSFNYNPGGYDGLDIDAQGAVTLNNVTATGNTAATGVYIYSSISHVGNVIINGGTFSHQNYGVIVYSQGTIKVSNVVAEYNVATGISLDNTANITGSMGITIANAATNYNSTGLGADSYGLISVNKVNARFNSNGVNLNNDFGALAIPKGITLTSSLGINNASNNDNGFIIRSRGPVTLTGLIANENTIRGLDLDESGVSNGGGKITLTNITTLHNIYSGIFVNTLGAFLGNNITSNYNGWTTGWDGLSMILHNNAVTISNSVFMENNYGGIWTVNSPLTWTLTNVVALGNGSVNITPH